MQNFNFGIGGGVLQLGPVIDYEWQQIIMRLKSYGKSSTGTKFGDITLLHSIELEKAKSENTVTSKFLTLTKQEQEKIQEKKKEKRVENNPNAYPNTQKGAKVLGEQLYLAIKMKQEKEEEERKMKVEVKKKIS